MQPYYTIEKIPNNRQLDSEEEEEANKTYIPCNLWPGRQV
jgi:hypothetical protein